MFTCYRISDVEYYIDEADKAARDSAAYYLDNGAGEDKGQWWSPEGATPAPFVQRGSEVSPRAFRNMGRGLDPTTGQPLIQLTKAERTAGYDMQFAAPKSVSVLWATASPELRGSMEAAQRAAVRKALDFAHAQGLIITRRGKGGADKEAVEDVAVAEFMHTTSRSGDPQLHSHAVLLNVCTRTDGSTGTLDNARILQYQGAMGAVYRAELSASLAAMGLSVRKDERNFRIDGVPDEVSALFSKRREAIEAAAEAAGYTTAGDRERARMTAVATRDRKSDVPERAELEGRWKRELQGIGWSAAAVWDSARAAARRSQNAMTENGINDKVWQASERRRQGIAGVEALESTSAVLERRHLLREVTERMQGIGNADDAMIEVDRLEREGHILRIGSIEDQDEPVYATPGMVDLERTMLRGVLDRQEERDFVPAAMVEAAIARKAGMSEEQAAAVRHALSRDGVSVIEGSAGTGKSYSLGGVADAARDAGMHVYVVAPSHKAKDVIRHDTTTDEDSAKAVQGFINRLDPKHKDPIMLTPGMAIIVDEAGMVGTRDLAALLRHAQAAGAKVILSGDTRQLQPVSAGGPMAVIARTCGTQRIEAIRRQRQEWQRAASHDFATGNAERAIDAYHDAGKVMLARSGDAALEALATAWREDVALREQERAPGQAEKPDARLVVAGRNKDVKALNQVLRGAYREAGMLDTREVELQAISRGQNGKVEALRLAEGDRLIFGESVIIGTTTINNSDMGRVQAITQAPGHAPIIRVQLDKGGTVEGPWSAFVGRRDEDAPLETMHPKVQHGYAVTVHASQGTTVDRCFTYNGHGMGMESAYVAMTRHRDDAHMFVDASRILDRLEARKEQATVRVSSKGRSTATDVKDAEPVDAQDTGRDAEGGLRAKRATQGTEFTDADLMKVLRREVLRSETKRNVSDFVEDARAWAKGEERPVEPNPSSPIPPDMSQHPRNLEESLAALDRMVAAGATAARQVRQAPAHVPNPPKQEPPATMQHGGIREERLVREEPEQPAPHADALRRRMEERARGPAYPVQQGSRPPISQGIRGMTPEQELQAFSTEIDLPAFLESRGYQVTERWSGGQKLQYGDSTLHVARRDRWVWTTPDGTASGSIVAYLQKMERVGSLGEVRKQLRAYMGESLDGRNTGHLAPRAVALDSALRAAPSPVREYDFPRVRQFWTRMEDRANEWLQVARGIKREVLDRFKADIRTEGKGSKQNPGGACFAHRDEHGDVTGYQRKGPKQAPTDKRGFSMWSGGGQKLITRMGDRENPQVVYVGETSIDLLSAYQHDGQPARALLCALDGASSREALDEVAKLARRHSEARFLLAFDNDRVKERVNPHTGEVQVARPAGEVLAERVEAAIRAVAPTVEMARHFPPAEFKDWNDTIRGISRELADQQQDRAAAEAKAQEAAENLRHAALSHGASEGEISLKAHQLLEDATSGEISPEQAAAGWKEIARMQQELAARKAAAEQANKSAADFAAALAAQQQALTGPRRT